MGYYLLTVHAVEGAEPPAPAEIDRMFAAVDTFNDGLKNDGAWVFAGGLEPPPSAKVVTASEGGARVDDGTFSDSAAQPGGFWIVGAKDDGIALDLAERASAACGAPVELRAFQQDTEG